jgi:uncharacterized membrane protein SpoIIM required for sporulation
VTSGTAQILRRFREEREADWSALEALLAIVERRSARALNEDQLLQLPVLYRAALSSLSVARETMLDQALVQYLEQLCARAYFQVYGVTTTPGRRIAAFFVRGWPAAVRMLWRETSIALALTVLGTIVGLLLVRQDASWFYALVDRGMAGGRDPTASTAALRSTLYNTEVEHGWLMVFATSLFSHNAQVAIFCFALGFAFGVPTAILLVYNGLMLGAFLQLYVSHGLGLPLVGWLMIHGTTELFAIVLAGAAGFRIGWAVAFPGRQTRMDCAVRAGRSAATVMLGVVVMLFSAGLLEGIGRESINGDGLRYAIAAVMLSLWLVYFYSPRARRGA